MACVPALREGVVLEASSGQTYLYDTRQGAYALLDNDVAVQIARLCDGAHSVDDIAREVAAIYDQPLSGITADVLEVINFLATERFINTEASDAGSA